MTTNFLTLLTITSVTLGAGGALAQDCVDLTSDPPRIIEHDDHATDAAYPWIVLVYKAGSYDGFHDYQTESGAERGRAFLDEFNNTTWPAFADVARNQYDYRGPYRRCDQSELPTSTKELLEDMGLFKALNDELERSMRRIIDELKGRGASGVRGMTPRAFVAAYKTLKAESARIRKLVSTAHRTPMRMLDSSLLAAFESYDEASSAFEHAANDLGDEFGDIDVWLPNRVSRNDYPMSVRSHFPADGDGTTQQTAESGRWVGPLVDGRRHGLWVRYGGGGDIEAIEEYAVGRPEGLFMEVMVPSAEIERERRRYQRAVSRHNEERAAERRAYERANPTADRVVVLDLRGPVFQFVPPRLFVGERRNGRLTWISESAGEGEDHQAAFENAIAVFQAEREVELASLRAAYADAQRDAVAATGTTNLARQLDEARADHVQALLEQIESKIPDAGDAGDADERRMIDGLREIESPADIRPPDARDAQQRRDELARILREMDVEPAQIPASSSSGGSERSVAARAYLDRERDAFEALLQENDIDAFTFRTDPHEADELLSRAESATGIESALLVAEAASRYRMASDVTRLYLLDDIKRRLEEIAEDVDDIDSDIKKVREWVAGYEEDIATEQAAIREAEQAIRDLQRSSRPDRREVIARVTALIGEQTERLETARRYRADELKDFRELQEKRRELQNDAAELKRRRGRLVQR